MSLLKHLSALIALYCGFCDYSLFTVLSVSLIVLALQASEFGDFTFDEIKVYENELIPKAKSVLFICLPAVTLVSFLYFVGLTMHEVLRL